VTEVGTKQGMEIGDHSEMAVGKGCWGNLVASSSLGVGMRREAEAWANRKMAAAWEALLESSNFLLFPLACCSMGLAFLFSNHLEALGEGLHRADQLVKASYPVEMEEASLADKKTAAVVAHHLVLGCP